MRKVAWSFAAVPLLMLSAIPSAEAATSSWNLCTILPILCRGNDPGPSTGGPSSSVPEPATMALFASGLGALGMSVYRRRKKSS